MKENHNTPAGYKNSPLGIIPEDWEVKRLGEIFSFKNGINSGKENYGQGIKFVNTMDVLGCSWMTNESLRGSITINDKQLKEFIIFKGDVLFNRTSETQEEVGYASVYIDDKAAVFGGFIIRAHDLTSLLFIDFKRYCFNVKYIRKQISSLGNGAIRYNLGQEDLSKVIITFPPLPEQQKIASILSTWDKAIEQQTRIIELLQRRKRGLMQQLLTGKKRLKGFSGEWKEVKLGEICKITTGHLDANAMKIDGSYPFFTCAKEVYKIDEYYFDTEALLISGNGEYVGYVHYCKGKFNAYQRTYVLDGFLDNIFYMKYQLEYSLPKRIIETKSSSNTPYIVISSLSEMSVFIPFVAEQTAIAEILTTADKEIDLAKQKLESLRRQKKGLMQVLLTGRKRVSV